MILSDVLYCTVPWVPSCHYKYTVFSQSSERRGGEGASMPEADVDYAA